MERKNFTKGIAFAAIAALAVLGLVLAISSLSGSRAGTGPGKNESQVKSIAMISGSYSYDIEIETAKVMTPAATAGKAAQAQIVIQKWEWSGTRMQPAGTIYHSGTILQKKDGEIVLNDQSSGSSNTLPAEVAKFNLPQHGSRLGDNMSCRNWQELSPAQLATDRHTLAAGKRPAGTGQCVL